MIDLHQEYLALQNDIDEGIRQVIKGAAFINGPAVDEFVKMLAKYLDVKFVIPCANGTDALQIALMSLELEAKDEVIIPANTYVAIAEVVALLGLTPVFVDVDPTLFTINIDELRKSITPRTKAIVPVHLYGQCSDMETILEIASSYNLSVIEDTAQALGASFSFTNGEIKKAGTMGLIGTTSFFPTKTLGCFGDGGAIFTNDYYLATKMKMIANHGQLRKYHHEVIGVNSRLDTIQAAVLNVKLKSLDKFNTNRNALASRYDMMLSGMSGVKIPVRSKNSEHVFHQYVIKTAFRDNLRVYLESHQISSMIHYPVPLPLQKAYNKFSRCNTPVAEEISNCILSLPLHSQMKLEEVDFVASTIRDFFRE
jgi:dTDP-4-amino-4,6-dideoxygalactose transaminase